MILKKTIQLIRDFFIMAVIVLALAFLTLYDVMLRAFF